jgi:hypothetical protein
MLLDRSMELLNTTYDETGLRQPRKEKRLAILGALWGAFGGAIVFGFMFFIPSLFMPLEYKNLFIIVGVALGIVAGAGAGPLALLRFSRGFQKGRTPRPENPG